MTELDSRGTKIVTEMYEADDIYIDCRPVDSTGEVIVLDEDNIVDDSVEITAEMFDDTANLWTSESFVNGIGFQTVLGLSILAIIYGLGNYVFNKIPSKIIDNKLKTSY